MYRIAICDDDSEYIKYLEKIIIQAGLKKEDVQFVECGSSDYLFR